MSQPPPPQWPQAPPPAAGKPLPVGAVIGIIAGAVVVIGGLGTAVVLLLNIVLNPPPVESSPDDTDAIFAALRLTDADVAYLGLEAGVAGRTASGLSLPVNRVQSEWVSWKGTPDECMFAGWEPGTSIFPVWGTETDADPLWTEQVVSAPQTVLFDDYPSVTITSRVFETDADASAFIAEHEERVSGCTAFATSEAEAVTATIVTAGSWKSAGAASAGWFAVTDDWIPDPVGPYAEDSYDVETRVLDIAAANVVTRIVLFTAPGPHNDELMDELGMLMGDRLLDTVR